MKIKQITLGLLALVCCALLVAPATAISTGSVGGSSGPQRANCESEQQAAEASGQAFGSALNLAQEREEDHASECTDELPCLFCDWTAEECERAESAAKNAADDAFAACGEAKDDAYDLLICQGYSPSVAHQIVDGAFPC